MVEEVEENTISKENGHNKLLAQKPGVSEMVACF